MRGIGVLLAGMLCLGGSVQAESVLRVRQFGDLKSIDPVFTSDYVARDHGYMVYDTLFAVDAGFVPRPQMVDTWNTSADGLAWTFHLRPRLAFSDGQKVTSADVVASLRRWGTRDGFGQLLMARTAALEAVDADTIRLTLHKPWGLVLDALAKPSSMVPFIMPARIAATPGDKAITDATGSGPFVMRRDQWVSGSRIVYAHNPGYVPRAEPASGLAGGKVAHFDRVDWVILPDTATAAAALRTGEIDIFEEIPPDLAPTFAGRNDVKLMPLDNVGELLVLRMNSVVPPFDNPKIRQALRYAVDQQAFLAAYGGDAQMVAECHSFLACTSPYATTVGWEKPDLEKARALVRESGYDGKPVVVLDVADYFTHAQAQVAAQAMRQIGLNAELFTADWGTITTRRASRTGWSLIVVAPSGMDAADPLNNFALRANCDKAWYGWPCDEAMETLRAAFAEAPDLAGRKAVAERLQQRAFEVGPDRPAGMVFEIRGYRADLSGFPSVPVPVYWNIERK